MTDDNDRPMRPSLLQVRPTELEEIDVDTEMLDDARDDASEDNDVDEGHLTTDT